MHAHTFTVPPFYITTGTHYLKYRPGCNIVRSNVSYLKSNTILKMCTASNNDNGNTGYKKRIMRGRIEISVFYNYAKP